MPKTFDLHEITDGVWAATATGLAGPAVSNAAIIDLGDRTLIVDTFMTMHAADELAAEAQRLTGRTAAFVVNTHWHGDHVGGNGVFGGVPVVGTARMRELIVANAPATAGDVERQAAAIGDTADRMLRDATTPQERSVAEGTKALADALTADASRYRLILPDVLVGDRLDLAGDRRATILGFGRGHTESDLFVHLPDDEVVVAGDLVWVGIHPRTSDGFPAQWADVLDRVAQLAPAAVVPGHGPPGARDDLTDMAAYLRQVEAMIDAVAAGELDATSAAPPQGSEHRQGIERFRAGLSALAGNSPAG